MCIVCMCRCFPCTCFVRCCACIHVYIMFEHGREAHQLSQMCSLCNGCSSQWLFDIPHVELIQTSEHTTLRTDFFLLNLCTHTHTHTDPHLYFLSITLSLHMVPFSLSSSLFTDIHIDISSLSSYRLSSCSMIVFLFQEKYTPFTNRCRSMQCLQCWLIF